MINFKVIGFGTCFCFVVLYILNLTLIKHNQEFHLHANKIKFSNYSKDQWQEFYKKKEVLYEQRRMKVKQYCSTQPKSFSRSWRYLLWVFYSTICIILVFFSGSQGWDINVSYSKNCKHNLHHAFLKNRFPPHFASSLYKTRF